MERKNGGRWLRGSKQDGKEGGSRVERKESKVKWRKQGGKETEKSRKEGGSRVKRKVGE